jgi:hypothetical protein
MPHNRNDPGARSRYQNKQAEKNVKRFFDDAKKNTEKLESRVSKEIDENLKAGGGGCALVIAAPTILIGGLLLLNVLSN